MPADAPRLDDLITLVHQQAPDDDALAQLAAAATLKSDLDELTDALLGHFVDQARRAGHSWSAIGEALGVSKQAAQQRHTSVDSAARRQLGRLAPKLASGPGFLRRFTLRAKAVLVAAEEVARGYNHDFVGTEHLLLGLFAEPEAIAAKVLDRFGVEREAVAEAVLAQVPPGAEAPTGHIRFTPRSKHVLEEALHAALELGHNYIGTEHLLLGLLAEPKGLAAEVLAERGVTTEAARAAVEELLAAG
jgi:hypothetical protein